MQVCPTRRIAALLFTLAALLISTASAQSTAMGELASGSAAAYLVEDDESYVLPAAAYSRMPVAYGSMPVSQATASPVCDRWYVALSGGSASRETVQETSDASTFIDFDTGFAANVALGYRFHRCRLEAEYSFMNNDCDQAGAGGLSSSTTGNVNLRALMFNAYTDIKVNDWRWKPYVGGGLGLYQSQINGLYPDFFDAAGPPWQHTPVNATSDTPFAYQFRLGASRQLGQRTEFFTGYRYFHGDTLTFASAPFATFSPTYRPDGAEVHNAEFGLRVRF